MLLIVRVYLFGGVKFPLPTTILESSLFRMGKNRKGVYTLNSQSFTYTYILQSDFIKPTPTNLFQQRVGAGSSPTDIFCREDPDVLLFRF